MKIIYTLSSAKLYLNSHPFKFQIFLLNLQPKIQQTKMLVMYQRFVDLFLFGLVWQYSSVQTKYDKGRFKVRATCSSNITLSLPSYTGSALKRGVKFCNGYLSLLYFCLQHSTLIHLLHIQ